MQKNEKIVRKPVRTISGVTPLTIVLEPRKCDHGIEDKVKADNMLESALKSIFAIAEGYPDLKANTNFLELQRELSSTEDRVAYSRQFYNDSILAYNNLCQTMPGAFFAKLYGKKEMEYLKIAEAEKKVVKVDF